MPTDNTTINAGSGGDVIADDYITDGGVANAAKVQRVKPGYGADGSYTDVSAATPLPTTQDSGTLLQRMELLLIVLERILSGAGAQPHDGTGRTRVVFDSASALTNVTTVAAVTKLTQLGSSSIDATAMAIGQSNLPALALRDRITVS